MSPFSNRFPLSASRPLASVAGGWVGVFLLSGVLLAGCHKEHPPAPAGVAAPVPVRVETVVEEPVTSTLEIVGTVRPNTRAVLESRIMGRITMMRASLGQAVQTGDELVRIDAAELEAQRDQARATLRQALQDLERVRALWRQEAATRAEFDAVENRHGQAEAALAEAEAMLAHATLVAPFEGVVTRKLADVGDLAAPGKSLIEIERVDGFQLHADVPDSLRPNVRLGDRLPVLTDGAADRLEGRVAEISPATDGDTRTFLVKIELPMHPGLRAGQFARVMVPARARRVRLVPESSVLQRGQMELVFVVTNDTARLRLVKTGGRFGHRREILSGLVPGERIVADVPATLQDAQPVSAEEAD